MFPDRGLFRYRRPDPSTEVPKKESLGSGASFQSRIETIRGSFEARCRHSRRSAPNGRSWPLSTPAIIAVRPLGSPRGSGARRQDVTLRRLGWPERKEVIQCVFVIVSEGCTSDRATDGLNGSSRRLRNANPALTRGSGSCLIGVPDSPADAVHLAWDQAQVDGLHLGSILEEDHGGGVVGKNHHR